MGLGAGSRGMGVAEGARCCGVVGFCGGMGGNSLLWVLAWVQCAAVANKLLNVI